MYLTDEQTEIGKMNFLTALGQVRGDYLRESLQHADVGPHYFGYEPVDQPVKAGIIGTGDEGCQAMIEQSSPAYLEYVAYHDIRPTSIDRGRRTFEKLYGPEQGKKVKFYEVWEDMLADDEIEAIVVATPLWTHHRFAIEAMKAGKHVLCEKLMSRYVAQGKEMVRTSDETKKVLSIGHQRHYSVLYDNALAVVRSGVLGDVRYIRALWHRNNTWPRVGYSDPVDPSNPAQVFDSWTKLIKEKDRSLNVKKYGYRDIEHLVRWRLYDDTGGGLMAELGSHQLDACSLFLGKIHPRRVSGVSGKYWFKDDRECDDHVYCTFEFPHPATSDKTGVVVTYSSINTNRMEGYGEIVQGTRGTMLIMNERDVMLFKEREKSDPGAAADMHVRVSEDKNGVKTLTPTPSVSLSPEAAMAKVALEHGAYIVTPGKKEPAVNRGYKNEIEAFAFAIRNPGYKVRCDGRVALADAVMALSANVAMRSKTAMDFADDWYDPASDAVPDAQVQELAKKP